MPTSDIYIYIEKEKMEPYTTEEILQCLSSVFIGHGVLVEENYDTIKILLTLFKQGEVPIKPIKGVIDPANPRINTTPGEVFSGRTRSEGGKVIQTILPFTDFFTRNLLHADITADSRFTFNPTNIHTGFNQPAQVIGKGTYGKIYKLDYDGKVYIVKEDLYTYSKSVEEIEAHYRTLFREAFINVVLQHDPVYGGHVGRLIKVFRKGNNILFMMEYIENTLENYIRTKNVKLDAEIAGELLDPNLRGPITDPVLTGFLQGMADRKESSEFLSKYTILHDSAEGAYPYTFKVFRVVDGNYEVMRLQLLENGVVLRKEKITVGNTKVFSNTTPPEWTPTAIQQLQYFILALKVRDEGPLVKQRKSQDFLNPIFHTLASALQRFRDTYGFFHRDLHGGNVMVSGDGKVKIIDFGMSCMRGITRGECMSYDLLIFVCSILQFVKGLDLQIKQKLNSFLTHGSSNLYELFKTRLGTKSTIFHLMYYNSMGDPALGWNAATNSLLGKIHERFFLEKFKAEWGAGDAPQFIYDNPCDMSVILHPEAMEEAGAAGGVGGAGGAAAPLPNLTLSNYSQMTGAAEGSTAGALSPIAMASLRLSNGSQHNRGKLPSLIAPVSLLSRKRGRNNGNGNRIQKLKVSGGRRTRRKRTNHTKRKLK